VPVLPGSILGVASGNAGFAGSDGLSRLAAAAFSSLSTFETSALAFDTSSLTVLWKFDARLLHRVAHLAQLVELDLAVDVGFHVSAT